MEENILTLHEMAELVYDEEIFQRRCGGDKYFNEQVPRDHDGVLCMKVIVLYSCVVDRLGIGRDLVGYSYDLDSDKVVVRLKNGSNMILPMTKEYVDYYDFREKIEIATIAKFLNFCDLKRLAPELESVKKRIWIHYLKSIPHVDKFSDEPKRMTKALKEYYRSLERPDGRGVVHTKHHNSLDEDMQIAEDFFNLAFNSIKFMGLTSISSIRLRWDDEAISEYDYQLYAVGEDGKETKLDLGHLVSDYDEERKMEIEELFYGNDGIERKKMISEALEKESIKFFRHEDSIFFTDRKLMAYRKVE